MYIHNILWCKLMEKIPKKMLTIEYLYGKIWQDLEMM